MLSFTAQKVRPLMCRFLKHYLGGGFAVSSIWEPIIARRWLTMAGCGNPKQEWWKRILPKKYRIQINNILSNYMMPSISGKGKSSLWHLVESIMALTRMRARDNLPKS